jgi:hypothetical protein
MRRLQRDCDAKVGIWSPPKEMGPPNLTMRGFFRGQRHLAVCSSVETRVYSSSSITGCRQDANSRGWYTRTSSAWRGRRCAGPPKWPQPCSNCGEHTLMMTSTTTGRFIASETNTGYLQRDIGGRPILSMKSGHTQCLMQSHLSS